MNHLNAGLSPDGFLEALPEGKMVLVDFYADWCEPCKYLDEILREMAPGLPADVEILKLDVDRQTELAGFYGIRSVPTLMIFKNRELKWRMAGFKLAGELIAEIEAVRKAQ